MYNAFHEAHYRSDREIMCWGCSTAKNPSTSEFKTTSSASTLTSVPSSTPRSLRPFPIPAQFVSSSYHNRRFLLVPLGLPLLDKSGSMVNCESISSSVAAREVTNGPKCAVDATECDWFERLYDLRLLKVDATFPKRRGFWIFSMIRETSTTDMLCILVNQTTAER